MTTENNKFKIQGVGIDTSTIITKPWKEDDGEIFDYIHTSISSNNDFLISDYVKSQPGASLITTIDFINNPETVLLGHIMELGRNKIDLLLVSGDVLEKNLENLKDTVESLRISKLIDEIGISNPSSVDQIKNIEKSLEDKIKFISLNICPLHFEYDIIKYARENSIDILGFNPFGGYISSNSVISSFTVPYLLGFSSTYSTIVFLSGRDLINSINSRDYIRNNIIGADYSTKFILKKNVSRLYKPLKKVVDTSFIVSDNLILSYNIPTLMYPFSDICVTLGKEYNLISIPTKNRTKTEENVDNLLYITEFPDNVSLEDKYAITRYQVLSVIRARYPEEEGWKVNMINLGDRILGIGIVREIRKKKNKFWKGKKEIESNNFLLAVPNKDVTVFLENPDLKNTSQEE